MSREESYWRSRIKYAVMSTLITFVIGGIFSIMLLYYPTMGGITLNGFVFMGFYSIAVLWAGVIIGRYLLKFGIIRDPN